MKHYSITLIHNSAREVLNIIAPSAMEARRIGIRMMQQPTAPFAIICKLGSITGEKNDFRRTGRCSGQNK